MRYLIDTNILIDHLRGDKRAGSFLEDIENQKSYIAISVITEYELLAYPKLSRQQEKEILSFLRIFIVLNITPSIVKIAAGFRSKYKRDVVDSLIAATAYKNKSILVTRNIKHFQNIKEIRTAAI